MERRQSGSRSSRLRARRDRLLAVRLWLPFPSPSAKRIRPPALLCLPPVDREFAEGPRLRVSPELADPPARCEDPAAGSRTVWARATDGYSAAPATPPGRFRTTPRASGDHESAAAPAVASRAGDRSGAFVPPWECHFLAEHLRLDGQRSEQPAPAAISSSTSGQLSPRNDWDQTHVGSVKALRKTLDRGESFVFGDHGVDLGILVIPCQGEPGGLLRMPLVLRPGEPDRSGASGVTAFAQKRAHRSLVPLSTVSASSVHSFISRKIVSLIASRARQSAI
jgi:hypothetical protein